MKRLAQIFIILGLVSFIGIIIKKQFEKIMDFAIKIKSIKIEKITKDNLLFYLNLNFKNNSDIDFKFKKQYYEVYVKNILVSKAEIKKYINIQNLSTTLIPIKIDLNLKELTHIGDLLNSLEQITIKIKLQSNTFGIPYKFETEYKTSMSEILNGIISE